ncbi:MAG: hypothetical protein H0V17_30345 [Deltaproteobacteria bacterium]|nr:hypothetical protein [Deltaproteobacteria bacterium]
MYRMLFAVVAACSHPPPHATAVDAQRANVALDELTRGRTLLIEKCSGDGGCHRTPLPQDARATEWPEHVADMAERSKITAHQKELIEQYLVVMSVGAR